MRSTFTGIEVAKRSLFTQQAALATTGHNIANANTRGYTRQVVNMVAAKPLEAVGMMRSTVPGQMGQGVEFDHIDRIRQKFLDNQFMNENKSFGDWEVRKDTLGKLEAIVNEPSDTGIRQVIEGFWNAWQELSKSPENLTARVMVKEKTLALTDAFNHTGKQLDDLSKDLTENIKVKVNQSNSMISSIAKLNNQIFRIEGLGDNANDLRDQRDVLMDDLSKIMNISVTEESDGYNVKMGKMQLVTGQDVSTVLTSAIFQDSFISGDLNSGEVNGMITARDTNVANFKFQLDSMIEVIATGDMKVTLPQGTVIPEGTTLDGTLYSNANGNRTLASDLEVTVKGINGLHALGYSGVNGTVTAGTPLFTLRAGETMYSANSVTVNPDIIDNIAKLSTSMRTYIDPADGIEKVIKGNNDMALLVSDIRQQKVNFDPEGTGKPILTDGTFDEFYRSLVGELGVQSQEATRQATNQKILVDQADASRQSISGVSLDEEMANMIKFQHAYNAAARSLTTFDEMLDKVINGMGIVGR
jgi:flagellar hook-associated protein 1 FlgK